MELNAKKIKEIYGNRMLAVLDENLDDVVENLNYLIKRKFTDVYDVLEYNPFLFLQSPFSFQDRVERLIEQLGVEYVEKLSAQMSLWNGLKRPESSFSEEEVQAIAISMQSQESIQEKADLCIRYHLPLSHTILKKTLKEMKEIITLCEKNNIPVVEQLFYMHPKKLENTIQFLLQEYGEEYVILPIVLFEKNHIQKVFAYISAKKGLDLLKTDPDILRLTLPEIIEREILIKNLGQEFVEGNQYNSIFELSRKNFQKAKKEKTEGRQNA